MQYTTLRNFFDGMLVMMLLYTLITYVGQRKTNLVYYALYLLSVLCYLTIDDTFFFYFTTGAPQHTINRYDFALGTTEAISFNLYGLFAIEFMGLRRHDPLTVRLIFLVALLSLISVPVHASFLLFDALNETVYDLYRTIVRYLLAGLALCVSLRILRLNNDVVNFFKLGSFFYITGLLTAVVMLQAGLSNHQPELLYTFPLLPIQLGMVLEAICFTIGFSVLNKRTEFEKFRYQEQLVEQLLENEKKQQKLQLIRDEIARDLHDEIGSDLSAMSIMCDIGARQVTVRPDEAKSTLKTIGKVSRQVLSTMREIVWSLNSTQDSLESMGYRMQETAHAMFDYTATRVCISISFFNRQWAIQPNQRRDFLLIYKEILHNTLKHATASNLYISVVTSEEDITLRIEDDGVGFVDTGETLLGNGLKNLRYRTDKLAGNLSIQSEPGNGTIITITCPLQKLVLHELTGNPDNPVTD